MPITYTLKHDGNYVHAVIAGVLTSAEVLAYLDSLEADPGLEVNHVTLFDARRAEGEDLVEDHYERVLERERRNPGKLVARYLAVVVSRNEDLISALRYEDQASSRRERIMVFTDYNEAVLWLKVFMSEGNRRDGEW